MKITGDELEIITPAGRLHFAGNELAIESLVDDPPKVRLGTRFASGGAVSFNYIRPDGVHEEVALVHCEITPGLGGLLKFFARRPNENGDQAMVCVAAIDVAGLRTATGGGVPPAPPPAPPPPAPASPVIVSQRNLSGTAADLAVVGDGRWLIAQNANSDTEVVAELSVAQDGLLRVEVRRVGSGLIAPYCYVWIDEVHRIHEGQVFGPMLIEAPIQAGAHRVRVSVSAQDGTVEIGGITAQS